MFKNKEDILKHFGNIPFLNGGLFDCLDSRKDSNNPVEIRLDGFSEIKSKQPIVPDKLFFGEHKDIDLSGEYDDKKKSKLTIHGLIDILDKYKFTIEENTPIEEEIALDPELLGKVFENLLASYNPETKTTARKQTGSFYTPREIVNYMVDESLKAFLKQQLADKSGMNTEDADIALCFLFEYNEKEHLFNKEQTTVIIKAIDNLKILDPACGSGAFPMGTLQKLIHVLRKIDPENRQWFEIVINKFPAYMQNEMRNKLKHESWDYVRKLGIIQECIYGVDIQPIAIQISKLRFFISLLVDQHEKNGADNRGFEALPNLDFKLVAANTLISAPQSELANTGLFAGSADPFFEKFDELTGKYFSANKPDGKKKLKDEISHLITDKCREKIESIENLSTHQDASYSKALTEKNKKQIEEKEHDVELWNSYKNLFKQEAVGFFEPKYFFPKAKDGFDVVIGNPPYIKEDVFKSAFDGVRSHECYQGKMDFWYLFGAKALDMLRYNGVLSFIATNNWVSNDGASKFRNKINIEAIIDSYIDFGNFKVFSAGIQTMVFVVRKNNQPSSYLMNYTKVTNEFINYDNLIVMLSSNDDCANSEYLKFRFKYQVSGTLFSEFTNY